MGSNATKIQAVQHRIATSTGLGCLARMRTSTIKELCGGNVTRFLGCIRKKLCCSMDRVIVSRNAHNPVALQAAMGKYPWKPMHSTLLPGLYLAGSQSREGKNIFSYKVSSLLARRIPLSGAHFQEILLEAIEPAKHPSTRRKIPRSTRKHLQPAGSQQARSRDALLKELTDIASEVIGTTVSTDAPLMESGLDSISATELQQQMS